MSNRFKVIQPHLVARLYPTVDRFGYAQPRARIPDKNADGSEATGLPSLAQLLGLLQGDPTLANALAGILAGGGGQLWPNPTVGGGADRGYLAPGSGGQFAMPDWSALGGTGGGGFGVDPLGLVSDFEGAGVMGEGRVDVRESQKLAEEIADALAERSHPGTGLSEPVVNPTPFPMPAPYPQPPVVVIGDPAPQPGGGPEEPEPEGGHDPVASLSEPADPESAGASAALGMALLHAVPTLWWSYLQSTQKPPSGHGGDPSSEPGAVTSRTGKPLYAVGRGWADEPSLGPDAAALAAAAGRWQRLRAMFEQRGDPPHAAVERATAIMRAAASVTAAAARMNASGLVSRGVGVPLALGRAAAGQRMPGQ